MLVVELGPEVRFRQLVEGFKETCTFAQLYFDEEGVQLTSFCSDSRIHLHIPERVCLSYHQTAPWLGRINLNDCVEALRENRKKHKNVIQILRDENQLIIRLYSQTTGKQLLADTFIPFTAVPFKDSIIPTLPLVPATNTFTLPAIEWKRLFMVSSVLGKSDFTLSLYPTHLEVNVQALRSRKSAKLWPCFEKDRDTLTLNVVEPITKVLPLRDVNFLSKVSSLLEELTINVATTTCAVCFKMEEGTLMYYT
jgi:hypothetical protein